MTFSSIIEGTIPHHSKFHSRMGRKITRIILHHWAGISGGDARLTNPNEEASATYIGYSDGRILGQVPEEYRPWTTGSWEADAESVTIELQNSAAGGDWPVSEKLLAQLIKLIADLAKRYGWGGVAARNVRGHMEFYATACPGPHVWNRRGSIITASAAAYAGGSVVVPPTPGAPSGDVDALARAVIRGEYGIGDERRRLLGSRFAEVQARVNVLLGTQPAKPAASVDQLANEVIAGKHGTGDQRRKALGNRYAEVQARVNQILGAAPATTPPSADLDSLARAVIAGHYGTGDARRAALGERYDQVQQRVNEILGAAGSRGGGGINVDAVARAVIRGDYGNGDERRRRLGSNFQAVQARVDQILASA